ncbi:SDR family oxidoreductase [Legionella bononiensis]|uniref:SDR family oxidoreductase n=1 Tax=Legionella bononiensis TaxID=2793102 RepID=A0ABS1W7Y2_9GAMM|nr:SDR family oxidoreductase [Legionella bononiensis]MBL7480018.1 SDR family oxidoreductase [Legionella bononiensis]MBL7525468.1 SDR family oxidoreductase [Legionella bononiensis]MBL7561651.1 SDR family oxidoreductase [Legionella bononiensis]
MTNLVKFAKEPLSMFDMKDKVVVVTGGTGILGSTYCECLVNAGATVVIADLSQEKCDALSKKLNDNGIGLAKPYAVDLSSEESIKSWAEKIIIENKKIDVLINNAATKSKNFFKPIDEFSLDEWNFILNVNVTAIFLTAKYIGKQMVKQGTGSIINVSSIYGVVGPDQSIYEGSYYEDLGGAINTPLIYSTSKGAVIAMTKYLATYWGAKGIRTNTLTPGGVFSGQNDIFIEKYSKRVPLNRMANTNEMLGALLFLASDASTYVNGQNLIIDGGLTAW